MIDNDLSDTKGAGGKFVTVESAKVDLDGDKNSEDELADLHPIGTVGKSHKGFHNSRSALADVNESTNRLGRILNSIRTRDRRDACQKRENDSCLLFQRFRYVSSVLVGNRSTSERLLTASLFGRRL